MSPDGPGLRSDFAGDGFDGRPCLCSGSPADARDMMGSLSRQEYPLALYVTVNGSAHTLAAGPEVASPSPPCGSSLQPLFLK